MPLKEVNSTNNTKTCKLFCYYLQREPGLAMPLKQLRMPPTRLNWLYELMLLFRLNFKTINTDDVITFFIYLYFPIHLKRTKTAYDFVPIKIDCTSASEYFYKKGMWRLLKIALRYLNKSRKKRLLTMLIRVLIIRQTIHKTARIKAINAKLNLFSVVYNRTHKIKIKAHCSLYFKYKHTFILYIKRWPNVQKKMSWDDTSITIVALIKI